MNMVGVDPHYCVCFSAILFALLYGVDAGFEYNNATDRTDADIGFRDVDVIISTTSSHY